MKWQTELIGDTLAEVNVRDNGGRWSVEVLTDDCRVFRLRDKFRVASKSPPTRADIGRAFALWPEHWEEVSGYKPLGEGDKDALELIGGEGN